jgi:hypothetical protein
MDEVRGAWQTRQSGQIWKHHEAGSMTASSTPAMLCREPAGDLGYPKSGGRFWVTPEPAKHEGALAILPATLLIS